MSASQFPPLQSKPSTKHCTNCSTLMSLYSLPGHYGRSVEIDVCHHCNALWFDQGESTQLSPDGTVALFQLINERGGTSTTAASKFGEGLRCVTCGTGMRLTLDRVKHTRFAYQSCPNGHGRLTTFYNFLAEKQFVRELTQAERAKLATSVQQIKCSSCAAPVDIGKTDACQYCRAPVSVFDRDAAKKAIDHYLQARQQQLPMNAPSNGSNYGYSGSSSNAGNFGYHGVDLASDILFALGRAATRGIGQGGARMAPAIVGAGVGASAGSVLADGGTAATGGLLESIGSGTGLGGRANALPTASDALFGAGIGNAFNADLGASVLPGAGAGLVDSAGNALSSGLDLLPDAASGLPSATEALFGSAASSEGEVAGGFMGEIGGMFSDAAASGIVGSATSAAADLGGSAMEMVGGSAFDAAGDVSSSASEGVIDLVSDGLGSLLDSLFS